MRLQDRAKRMLERAASFEGKTVSNFILTSALEYAEKTIHEHEVMQLNHQDSEAFLNALDRPFQFNDKLAAALNEHHWRVNQK
nr:DUF1778 domain-containing protein [Xenorhabdus bovienii]